MRFFRMLTVAGTLSAVACVTNESAKDAEAGLQGSSSECPAVANSCSAGCTEAKAKRYDAERECRFYAVDEVIGCQGSEINSADSICAMSDGGTWLGSSSVLRPPTYIRCDDGLTEKVRSAPDCN